MELLKKCVISVLIAGLIAGLTLPTALAQDTDNARRYITDILLVPLRSGPSMEYRIINSGLRSGTPVTLIEQDEETGWSRVRVENQEGWLPNRYLINEPVAREQLTSLRDELETLRGEYSALQESYAALREERLSADNLYQEIENERDEALAELERVRSLSENAVELDERNQELITQNTRLENENERLRSVNETLQDDTRQWRLAIGGSLVIAGLLLGLLLPALVGRKRGSGWA